MDSKKKKILIVSHFMHIGGAERALLGLLESLDLQKYEVDLFLFRHEGELFNYIPTGINILPIIEQYTLLACPIYDIYKRHPLISLARIFGKYRAKLYNLRKHYGKNSQVQIEYSHKYTRKLMPQISNKEYDLAISFLTPHYFVAEKVMAKKKVAWIHTDYTSVRINVESELRMWSVYDNIISISDMCTKAFIDIFPSLKKKIIKIENPLPIELIKSQAQFEIKDMYKDSDKQILFLSIGRFSEQKNFDNVPIICRLVRSYGCDIKWYLIGYGNDEKIIRDYIRKEKMEKYVIILGKKENPYPYIKKCDWYVQPSRYEGKAVTVREAQILHKPVIITNYLTAKSQLHNGIDGIIVPLDNYACAEQIVKILKKEETKQSLVNGTFQYDYSGRDEIYKLDMLIGD